MIVAIIMFVYDLILQKNKENIRLLLSKTINCKVIINNKIIKSMKSFFEITLIQIKYLFIYVSVMMMCNI